MQRCYVGLLFRPGRDRVDKILVLLGVRAPGDGQRLAAGFVGEGWRSHVGYPYLDRAQALAAQPFPVGADFFAGGLGTGGRWHG
jgi:hypothetical protein